MIELTKGNYTAKILPEIGGRLVYFSNNNENILKSDENLWDGKEKPAVNAEADFVAFNGAIVWVGPQSQWWTQQEINPERKEEKADWPPDPYLIYGKFKTIFQSDSSVTLECSESPVSGITMKKTYTLHENGKLECIAEITNCTDKAVSWDIWFNTRMDGYCKGYTFCKNQNNIKVVDMDWEGAQPMPKEHNEGYFCFNPIKPETKFNSRSSKAFIHAEKGFMAGFDSDRALIIEFDLKEKEQIHPEQGLVEIFDHSEHDKDNALLELEYHSEYKTLQPNETFSAKQRWVIQNYTGGTSTENQINVLKELGY